MGFFFSKPNSELTESLIKPNHDVILKMGDLLLIPSSDIDISLDSEPWQHIALVVSNTHVYSFGQLLPIPQFVNQFEVICVRQLHCKRPTWFEKKFKATVQASINDNTAIDEKHQESFDIANVLVGMDIIIQPNIANIAKLRPYHFSAHTPFKKLDLNKYSEHLFF